MAAKKKPVTKKKTPKSPKKPTPAAGAGGVATVRMYRQGLGDCFLVTLPGAAGPFRMLIDCGVFVGTPNEKAQMQAVAADVSATASPKLDVLVATHEHYDHLIGFKHAATTFDAMTIDQVWLAWTEDATDKVAKQLRTIESGLKVALQQGLTRMRATPGLADRANRVRGLLEWAGDPLAADYSQQLGDIMKRLRTLGKKPPRLLWPGEKAFTLEGVPSVRVFVLGPPHDLAKIKAMNDPGGETYRKDFAISGAAGFAAAVRAPARERDEAAELAQPFEPHLRVSPGEARGQAFFREHYGFGKADAEAWRRIDDDWLHVTEELGVQLANLTNNSSLAFALELGEDGPVLLFAADAQVGNWLSWHEYTWKVPKAGGGERTVTAKDLLERTALYKVGHHGSHNATLRAKGLEMMKSADLVAMLPTNEAFARDKKHWEMPDHTLKQPLADKTHGRVLRADDGLPAPAKVDAAVRAEFQQRARAKPLYVEYDIPMK